MFSSRLSKILAGALATVIILGGCSLTSIGVVSAVSPPAELASESLDGPWVFTIKGKTYLGLSGSSSCPTIPTELRLVDDDEIFVQVAQNFALICTADLETIVYELPIEQPPSYITIQNGDDSLKLVVVDF